MNNIMIMPKTIYPSKEEVEKLGFIFLESENKELYNVILPEGWVMEEDKYFSRGTEEDKIWKIYDEYGNLRGKSSYLPTLKYFDSDAYFLTYYSINKGNDRGTYYVWFGSVDEKILYEAGPGSKEDLERLIEEVILFAETNYKGWNNIGAYWPKEQNKKLIKEKMKKS